MNEFRVVWTETKVREETIIADTLDDAREKWEEWGLDAELFFIEDEEGNQVIFD